MKLQDLFEDGYRDTPNPLPMAGTNVLASMASYAEHLTEEDGHEEAVPIDKIFGTEDYLDGEHLEELAQGTRQADGLPMIMRLRDKYVLMDGNHKVAAAQMRGEKEIKALVFNVGQA